MSIRTRLQRLERTVYGEAAAKPLVMLFEVFGDDDRGGGWRNRELGNLDDLVTQREDGRTFIVRPLLIEPEVSS